jgi:hypothetical protein
MPYKFACFISYKHPPRRMASPWPPPRRVVKHWWTEFADAFQEELDSFISLPISSFRDAALTPGTKYPRELSENLCLSLCLVALVVPQYFESAWCVAEWNAMAAFESTRVGGRRLPLIIPVLFGGDQSELEPYFGGRTPTDLRGLSAPGRQLRNPRNRDKIKAIAEIINKMEERLRGTGPTECDQFSLGLGPEDLTPLFPQASPLAR